MGDSQLGGEVGYFVHSDSRYGYSRCSRRSNFPKIQSDQKQNEQLELGRMIFDLPAL